MDKDLDKILKLERRDRTENKIKKNYPDIYSLVLEYTDNLNLHFSRKLWHFLNKSLDIPVCKVCKKNKSNFNPKKFNYSGYCSKTCAANDIEVKEQRQKTIKEKYGHDSLFKSEYFIKKRKETLTKKYGKNFIANEKIQNKIKKTCTEKYGVNHIYKSDSFLNKRKNTWKNKYETDHPLQNKLIKEKRKNTLFEKYIDYINAKYAHLKILKITKDRNINIFCDICKKEYLINSFLLHQRVYVYKINPCLHCNKLNSYHSSGKEKDLINFLKNLKLDIKISDRTILNGNEIDVYIPEKRIGFEFNGVYWHSEANKSKKYHLEKTNLAQIKNIKLIHIWEDDWMYKQDIVKSRIKNILGLSDNKIYARKCIIKQVSPKDSIEFLNRNHIQSAIGSSVKLGLYYGDELVSLMTFGKLRKNLGQNPQENEWELLRFCNKLNTNVIGGASKLFKHFLKEYNPIKIISYADCDWTPDKENNLYVNLEFKVKSHTGLNYEWVVDGKRENRFKYRKDVLVKEGADIEKTEIEIMHERGYYRVFKTGNYKFEWNNTK